MSEEEKNKTIDMIGRTLFSLQRAMKPNIKVKDRISSGYKAMQRQFNIVQSGLNCIVSNYDKDSKERFFNYVQENIAHKKKTFIYKKTG